MAGSDTELLIAILVVVVLFVIYLVATQHSRRRHHAVALYGDTAAPPPPPGAAPSAAPERFEVSADAMIEGPQRGSVAQALTKFYNTEDVDPLVMSAACGGQEVVEGPLIADVGDINPLVTGNLYVDPVFGRNVYTGRTALGKQGLSEFSTGNTGEVGEDVGPYGLYEYGGKVSGYDDGIPAQWAMPSTPIRWYADPGYDNYTAEGPTAFNDHLAPLYVPDHLKLLGEDHAGTAEAATDA